MEDNLFQEFIIPDVVTPAQYYDGADDRRDAAIRPIKRLMLAVLEDAIRCYEAYRNARAGLKRQIFAETELWLWDRKADGPFAFETICDTLGINAQCLRRSLREPERLDSSGVQRLVRRLPVVRAVRLSAQPKRRQRRSTRVVSGGDFVAA